MNLGEAHIRANSRFGSVLHDLSSSLKKSAPIKFDLIAVLIVVSLLHALSPTWKACFFDSLKGVDEDVI